MDIDYLLLLQNFRESTNNVLSPFLSWLTKFSVSFWPIAMVCMVFWVFDRKEGRRMIASLGLSMFLQGFLKLTFQITRPWLKDPRVVPYGDSIVAATGFSFPSGHASYAGSIFGSIGRWQWKRNRALSILCFVTIILVLFSRNYLGVHTPQDVIVGCLCAVIMIFVAYKIEDWTDKDIRRDRIVLIGGLVLCVVAAIYYRVLNVEKVYDATGRLVVDPPIMKADSYEGIGLISAYVISRFIERRYFDFDTRLGKKDRFIIGVFALIPLYWWWNNMTPLLTPISKALGKYLTFGGFVFYTMLVVPLIMQKIKLPKWMREEDA